MATNASIRILKTIPFKGGTRTWSNRYHFNGGTPADATHWHTLMDNVVTAEKAVLPNHVVITLALGYAAGSDVPVASKVYSTAGTVTSTGGKSAPGEVAGLVRWSTAARSTKNHPIYAFSYFHGVYVADSGVGLADPLTSAQKTALSTYATAWITGFSDGTITAVRATPAGHVATGSLAEEYATHRDFPYSSSV